LFIWVQLKNVPPLTHIIHTNFLHSSIHYTIIALEKLNEKRKWMNQ
jgi:hypothetical protein